MKICALYTYKPSNKTYRDFGLEYLEKHYDVTVLTTAEFDECEVEGLTAGLYRGGNILEVKSFFHLWRLIKKRKGDTVFLVGDGGRPFFYKVLYRTHATYCILGSYGTTIPICRDYSNRAPQNTNANRSLLSRINHNGVCWVYHLIKIKIVERKFSLEKLYGANPPIAWFYSDSKFVPRFVETDRLVYVPSVNYNEYIELKRKNSSQLNGEYILFIHSGLGFRTRGLRPIDYEDPIYEPDNNKLFFRQIETVLEGLETHFGMPIKIAMHPHVDYGNYSFGGRDMIKGETARLAMGAKFLIYCSNTTTWSYSVMFRKPVLYLYNSTRKLSPEWVFFDVPLMEALSIKGCDMDDEKQLERPWDRIEEIDEEIGRRYFDDYVRFGNYSEETVGEIMQKTFERFFKGKNV